MARCAAGSSARSAPAARWPSRRRAPLKPGRSSAMSEELLAALARAVWRRALPAGLLLCLAALLAVSLDQAGWVSGVQWWPGVCLALLGGAALANTRWRGRWALGYAAALMLAGAAEMVGHVLPDLAQLTQDPA